MILPVVFVVFMIFAFMGSGLFLFGGENPNRYYAIGSAGFFLWVCVAILGWIAFGGSSGPLVR